MVLFIIPVLHGLACVWECDAYWGFMYWWCLYTYILVWLECIWHGHMHGMWFTMWVEHDLMPGLWELCITLVLATPLHFICVLHDYC